MMFLVFGDIGSRSLGILCLKWAGAHISTGSRDRACNTCRKVFELLLLIVTLVFNIQIYSVDTCSSDGILGPVPGAIER